MVALSLLLQDSLCEFSSRSIARFDRRRGHHLIIIIVFVICGKLVGVEELAVMLALFDRKQGVVSLQRAISHRERNQRLH
jgi:hypothetical protein